MSRRGAHLPSRKNQNGRMAAQRIRQYFGAFDTEIDPAVLNRGNRRLRNTRQLRELILAQLLEFANDADRVAD